MNIKRVYTNIYILICGHPWLHVLAANIYRQLDPCIFPLVQAMHGRKRPQDMQKYLEYLYLCA